MQQKKAEEKDFKEKFAFGKTCDKTVVQESKNCRNTTVRKLQAHLRNRKITG